MATTIDINRFVRFLQKILAHRTQTFSYGIFKNKADQTNLDPRYVAKFKRTNHTNTTLDPPFLKSKVERN